MSNPSRTDISAPVLAVNGITVSFPAGSGGSTPAPEHRREVVHGVGFDLVPGRVLALVGESGSGKSVTAMSILDLLPPSARFTGSVRLEGQELVGAGPDQLRAVRGGRIGTIFQEPMSALNPVFTVGNQIAEGLRQHRHDLSRDEADRRVLELLESVEVRDPERVARSYPHELSGGQLQRAMIAMAIGNEPVVLIADEPTTALDVTVQAGILGLLRDLKDRLGTAVLLITHDMGVVADLADDVVVMREGRVVETADVGTLFASPRDDYTKTLLAAVPRLAALQISERARHPEGSGSAADGTVRDTPATDGTGTGATPTATPAAQLSGASVVYRGRGLGAGLRAVDRVSLTIAPGEVLGLVGESGSGKSTVGRALAGLVPVSEGQAQLAGIDIARVSRRALRRARTELGIVFQDPASSLNPRHTIGHSISEPIRLHRRMPEQAVRARVRELLDAVQLGAALEERLPHELSGGQRQRVAIARAISLEPALLIADEPTSALDVSVQARILDLVRELQADLRFACLFISHDLAVVGEVTSRVAVMHRGVVVEEGRTGEVLTRPRDPYTQRLLAAAPVADPAEQRQRREAWQELMAG